MPRLESDRVISSSLHEHPAVQAWSRLRSTHVEPSAVHVLKERLQPTVGKSAVYRLAGAGPGDSAVVAKRCLADTALVERTIYEEILPRLPVSRLRYYGFLDEPGGEVCWLFLEDATGEAYSPHAAEHRLATGRWLGRMHTAAQGIDPPAALPDRGPNHYREHMRSAWSAISDNFANPALSASDREVLLGIILLFMQVESNWQQLEALCRTMPSTLVHGDFVGKNIRLQKDWQGLSVLAFDWEMAGWGTPVADLAQTRPGPDIYAYWESVQGEWPTVGLERLERLACVGTIFRLLASVDWIAGDLASWWVRRAVEHLSVYKSRLSRVVGAAEWST
jgi:hypothetical protein